MLYLNKLKFTKPKIPTFFFISLTKEDYNKAEEAQRNTNF